MEGSGNPSDHGLWKVGMLLEASSRDPVKQHPMRVLEALSGPAEDKTTTIALCKQHLLATYDFVNEYTSPSAGKQPGCVLHSADESSCHFPSVVIVPCSKQTIDHTSLFQDLQLTSTDLELLLGLPVTSNPNILLVSQHFMQAYGFFNKEQVWYRSVAPVSLERVILTPCDSSEIFLKHAESIVEQLYTKSRKEPLVMSQDFDYVIRATLPVDSKSKQTSEVQVEERVLTFRVLEATPTLQGVVTENTTIVLLPPDEQEVEVFTRSTELRTSRRRNSGRRRSSAASASEIPSEEVDPYFESFSSGFFEDYTLDVVAARNFKLKSHCVLLPKLTAASHGIYHCQNVWVSPVTQDLSSTRLGPTRNLDDLVLSLANEQGQGEVSSPMHSALVFVYEDEFELEQYIPPTRLGVEYETSDLMRAYVHPELLFYLYPETLSYTRKYQLVVKHCREPAPALREMKVSEVHQPNSTATDNIDLLHQKLREQSLSLNTGDVITVKSESGKQYYKVVSLDPSVNNSSVIDNSIKWECTFTPNKVYSHVPDLVPPAATERPPFFEDIAPPGLEDYCDTLFSFVIPAFRDTSSTQPRRSPSVLVTAPRGLGKRTVVKAVARRCRMNVVEINCFDFASDVAGFSEKKITVDLDKASSNVPVIIVLRNVHMMGMKDTIRQEPRLLSMFELYMSKVDQFNRTGQYPIVVVGVTTHAGLIPPRVQACFLHQLEMAPPSQAQRLAMLESVGRGYHTSPGVDLGELAKRTAGFCLGDLLALYSSAHKLSYLDVHKYCSQRNSCTSSADLAVSGIVVSWDHLEQALFSLHSSHADSIGAPKIPDVKWEDVGGLGEAKREILDTIQLPLLHPDLFSSGLQRSGVLLYGPPGTGKTLLAKAVATECSLNFLSVKGPELINMYVGQSEENIREVFSRASSAAPCVIFFDELDSIAPNRGRKGDSGGVMDRVVSQLLAELDGLNKSEHVFVIGASNRPDLIDPALLRPGRFDRMVYLGISEDPEAKVKILRAITRKFNLSSEVDLMDIATKCPPNLTGADLYSLASDALLTALRRQIAELEKHGQSDDQWEGLLTITKDDFSEGLQQLTPSVPASELERYISIKEKLGT